MARYAASTDVSSDRSRAEIERTLRRYGASKFAYGWDHDAAHIAFTLALRHVRFRLPMPDRAAREFTHTPGRGLQRSVDAAEQAYEQAVRQRWRALALVIKAKLEAVEAGITTLEDEFLAHIMLEDGRTVGEYMLPAIDSGQVPALTAGGGR